MSSKSSSGQKSHRPGGRTRDLDNDDAITILNAVVDFRSKHGGSAPTPTTMKPVLDAVKGPLNRPDITIDQLYNKFRSLKNQYFKAVTAGVGPTPFERKFYELSVKAWGAKRPSHDEDEAAGEIDESSKQKKSSKKMKIEENSAPAAPASASDDDDAADADADADADDDDDDEEEEEEDDDESGDFGNSFKYLTDQAKKYWEMKGLPISSLELGLKFIDKTKAATLERKCRQHFKEEMKIQAKSFDVMKDLNLALIAAEQKGARS